MYIYNATEQRSISDEGNSEREIALRLRIHRKVCITHWPGEEKPD